MTTADFRPDPAQPSLLSVPDGTAAGKGPDHVFELPRGTSVAGMETNADLLMFDEAKQGRRRPDGEFVSHFRGRVVVQACDVVVRAQAIPRAERTPGLVVAHPREGQKCCPGQFPPSYYLLDCMLALKWGPQHQSMLTHT